MKKYLTKIDFENQNFYIDPFNLDRIFKENTFISYRVKKVPLGKIIMRYPGAYIRLKESPVYKYLDGSINTAENYKMYCKKYGKHNKNRTVEKYDELINDLSLNEYDIKKGIIVVNQLNVLLDGQHRSCLLLKRYGEKFKVPVLIIRDKRCTIVTQLRLMKDLMIHRKIINI